MGATWVSGCQSHCRTVIWFTPTVEIDEASPSEDEAAAQAALHAFQGNVSFQLQL